MITSAALHACSSLEDVAALFRRLGYRCNLQRIDPREWLESPRLLLDSRVSADNRRGGLRPPVSETLRAAPELELHHACREGRLDIYFATGSLDAARDVWRFLATINALRKSVIIFICFNQKRITTLCGTSARPARFEIDLENPRADEIERLNLLELDGATDPATLFDRAASREAIGKRFFRRFGDAVTDVSAALAASAPEAREARDREALLLLSRLLFLSFIETKGWLDGRRRFLSQKFADARFRERPLYESVLAPLFFGCLNTPRERRNAEAHALGAIPYLNGGLFEPSPFELRNTAMTLPDDLLASIVDETFDRFSFSTDESDREGAHIDPEMLGHVFESLMASDERLNSGSFYTPKRVVEEIVREALVATLSSDDRNIEPLVSGLARDERVTIDPTIASALLVRLDDLRVIDPACGSGAFLLSMLELIENLAISLATHAAGDVPPDLRQRIVERSLFGVDIKPEAVRLCELRLWLAIVSTTDCGIDDVKPLPNLDRNILQGNALLEPLDFLAAGRREVYAEWSHALRARGALVDRYRHATPDEKPKLCRLLRESDRDIAIAIVEKAIEIEERDANSPETANLFVERGRPAPVPRDDAPHRTDAQCASAPPPSPASQTKSESRRALRVPASDRIEQAKKLLASIESGEIDFFSFDVHFATTMSRGGFDTVVGNPPWIRLGRIPKEKRRILRDRFRFMRPLRNGKAGFEQGDEALAFVERAIDIAAAGGAVAMLVPAKFATAGYAATLRLDLARNREIVSIHDWSDGAKKLFDADTFPMSIVLRNRKAATTSARISAGSTFEIPHARFDRCGAAWALIEPEVREILRRCTAHPSLADTLGRQPVMGVKSGANARFFFREVVVRGATVEADGVEIPLEFLCRCVRGRDVSRFKVSGASWMLWPPVNGWGEPPAWATSLARKRGVRIEGLRLQYVKPEHLSTKVVWKDVSRGLQSVVLGAHEDVEGQAVKLVPNQTLYAIDTASRTEAHVLSAILNSTIFGALAIAVADRAKDAHFRYFASTIGSLPLPRAWREKTYYDPLARLGERAHRGHPDDSEMDAKVAAMYGADAEDLRKLGRYLRTRLGRE